MSRTTPPEGGELSLELPPYHNPFWSDPFADPFLLKVRGYYYAYATEGEDRPATGTTVFPILASPDMIQWRAAGKALPALGEPFFRYWAPEVTVDNGRFLLYYAVHTDEFIAAIRVAVAERPEGPFIDSGHDLTSDLFPWAIDPHVFRDADGCWYLYMTVEMWDDPGGLIGVGNVVDRLVDPFTLSGRPTRVTPPRHAWELFEARRPEKGGVDWYCVEGPAVVRHRGRYYEFFSGGCYYRDNYAVSYATSETPMGPGGMHDTSWQDWEPDGGPGWLMHGDPAHAIGPGHNSLVYGPNNADLYIAYHAWSSDMAARRPCLDRLFWHGDAPWTDAPSFGPQPAPSSPRLRALSDPAAPVALPERWQAAGGRWSAAPGHVTGMAGEGTEAFLHCPDPLGMAWLLEINPRHLGGEGAYGVTLATPDGVETRVVIDPHGSVIVRPNGGGGATTHTAPLPDGFAPAAWHQLVLSWAGIVLAVALDGLPLLEAEVGDLTGSFSLLVQGCDAAFSGISLTDHFRDEFLRGGESPARLGWRADVEPVAPGRGHVPASWQVVVGALVQTDPSPGQRTLYKGGYHHVYECGVTMRLEQMAPGCPAAWGLVTSAGAEGDVRVLLAMHPTGCALVLEGTGAMAAVATVHALPVTFDPHDWHTLRVMRRGEMLAVYLDGPHAVTVAVPGMAETFGLITRDAAAAFTGVWHTAYPA